MYSIKNTVWKTKDPSMLPSDGIMLPSYDEVLEDKMNYVWLYSYKNNLKIKLNCKNKFQN